MKDRTKLFPAPPELSRALLEWHRQRFEAGDKNALLQAVRYCLNSQLVVPDWAVRAFFRATNSWYGMRVRTLDEAFGLAWPKGRSFRAAKKKRELKFALLNAVNQHRSEHFHAAIDDELFERVGRRFGIGKTLVKDYYRAARRALGEPHPADELLNDLAFPSAQPRFRRGASQRRKK